MNFSYWERQTYFTDIDIAIIGSGIVGLCTALEVKAKYPTAKVIVFERGTLPSGASTKNAGFACFGSASELLKDLEQYTENEVFGLVEQRWQGLQKLRGILGDSAINYEPLGGYELILDRENDKNTAEKLGYLNQKLDQIIGSNVFELKNDKIENFGFSGVKSLVFNKYEGLLNSGNMMMALVNLCHQKGITILNGIEILQIQDSVNGVTLCTNGFSFNSSKVAICTNAFAKQLLSEIDIKPGRGQVIVSKAIAKLKFQGAFHIDCGYYYFRHLPDSRVLFGGGRNLDFEAEATTEFGTTPMVQNKIIEYLHNIILPNTVFEIDYAWSGIMAFGTEHAPLVKKVGHNIYYAIKCQGMGVALGANTAQQVASLM